MAQTDKAYWYPHIKNDEIVQNLSGWGLKVSTEQLNKPTSDFVISVYSFCLEQATGISIETMLEPVQNSLSSFENPYAVSLG